MRTIDKCAVCGSKRLKQLFHHMIGEFRTGPLPPPTLDGCYCEKCGVRYVFNKAGKCPRCNGSGRDRDSNLSYPCHTCNGTGKI